MNQLFYNIAGGIVHKIRREKRTTISEVIVRGKRETLSKINKIDDLLDEVEQNIVICQRRAYQLFAEG